MAPDEVPDTVTEAVQLLQRLGYSDEFDLTPGGVRTEVGDEPFETAVIDHVYRFEGESDPGDEAIVLGIHCTTCDRTGIVVSGYGASSDAEHDDLLRNLLRDR